MGTDSSHTPRPRVLCVSSDRSTRAALTRAFGEVEVNVAIAQTSSNAVDRLEHEPIDAVLVDANTVANVPGLLEAVESCWPGTPAFVHWEDDTEETVSLLAEVVSRTRPTRLDTALANTVAERVESEFSSTLDQLVGTIKRRLVDARSASDIERTVRESFLEYEGFVFAWLGEYDPGEREIVPWITNPSAVDWPMQRTFRIGDGGQPLLERVLHSGQSQVVRQIEGNECVVPLGEEARSRGVRSVAVEPLAVEDDRYGVLVVYGATPLSDVEHRALDEIAESVSYTLETVAIRGQLAQQERIRRRYERLVETAGDGMYIVDEDGHLTTVNDALVEMTGHSREGILGEPLSLLFGKEGYERERETSKRLLESESTTATFETVLETKASEEIPCETQVVLVEEPAVHGSVGVVRDITERKRRERKLREQNERLEAFAQIVSHDLRNPLGVSQGYLDLLEETESFDHLENVREGLERMEAIIGDVLTVAREGEWASNLERVDLTEVVREAWDNVSTEAADLEIDSTVTLTADRSPLLRLLENLFRNAIEHGQPDPKSEHTLTIRVGALEDGREGFYVADDGCGIPPELRQDVFDSSVSTGSSGIGLGLWVVREIAEGHGWTVSVDESSAGGARFSFAIDA
ncbi:PAS domain S-box protein [Halobacteria archaeon AArc-curdl1]|uniref:histidine kinase n=1 Tax=Natronosalvus hydrolyticus TaxID=2979988 RepID=A0AAP2ZAR8_9EURY|nr:PAS domain S-box protein [Halobacteria archaeon AArc-curdl1]